MLHVDGSSNEDESGVGIIFTIPRPDKYARMLNDNASKYEVEYKILIAKLKITKALEAWRLHIYSDSQPVLKQVTLEYQVKCTNMVNYFEKLKELLEGFKVH